jgi:hypothetical protein
MGSEELRKAAQELSDRLREIPSFVSVGIGSENGRPVLFLYFRSMPRRAVKEKLPLEWANIPVRTRKIGRIVPAR